MAFCLTLTTALIGSSLQRIPRVPSPTLEEAIRLVYAHHNKQPSAKPVFIDVAEFVREKGGEKSYWRIGVRLQEYESGHLIYKVSPDGKVQSDGVIKDG